METLETRGGRRPSGPPWRLLAALVLVGSLGCESVPSRCAIVEINTVALVDGVTEITALGEGRFVALAIRPQSPSRQVTVLPFDIAGTAGDLLTLPVPAAAGESPVAESVMWTGQGLAVMRLRTDPLPRSGAGDAVSRSVLTYQHIDAQGSTMGPREIAETECTNCLIAWSARSLGGRVQVSLLTLPLILAGSGSFPVPQYLVLSVDGAVTASGPLPSPGGGAMSGLSALSASLAVDSRGVGLVVASGGSRFLLDGDMAVTAGPIRQEELDVIDWDLPNGRIVRLRSIGDTDALLVDRFDLNGERAGQEALLSFGTQPLAVTTSGALVGALFGGQELYFSALDESGVKLGGDLYIELPAHGSDLAPPNRAAIVTAGAPGQFVTFVGSNASVERIEVQCVP